MVHLREADYLYGSGDLTLRVTQTSARLDDPEWVDLTGIRILWNGDRAGEMMVRVRVSALAKR
ncbi:hypothetical protein [Micromonospora zhanjiangensis]|uniref:Uncharacterized protein n=1 Tax=Micromonospora zhanjiangensis TaxID=1522057 RepID=A0ABV8KT83_9ACTN